MGEFFFTLARADHLNRKHTIFGKVSGTTVFNMLRLAEVELGPGDDVINPHSIRSTEVLSNPFEELVPRPRRFKEPDNSGVSMRTCHALPHRNLSLLSFGDEAAEEEGQMIQTTQELRGKSKSSHDLLLNDCHLSSIPVTADMVTNPHKDKVVHKAEESKKILVPLAQDFNSEKGEKVAREEKDDETEGRKRDSSKLTSMLYEKSKKLKTEIDMMKETDTNAETMTTGGDWEKLDEKKKDAKIYVEQGPTDQFEDATTRFKNKKRQGKGSTREAQTLMLLEKFRGRLTEARQPKSPMTTDVPHQTSGQLDDEDDAGWMSHSLLFSDVIRNARDANTPSIDDYSIHDPRHPLTQRRRKGGKGSELEKVKEEERK
uniref:spliceosome-associated protein CWC27 homolog n=1 Tax=Myxine glutinosa TaxID=7769 RepID=UPI00358E1651